MYVIVTIVEQHKKYGLISTCIMIFFKYTQDGMHGVLYALRLKI